MYIKKSNKILVGCLAFLVTIIIGYAIFSGSVTVTGTATANGSFDMVLTCVDHSGFGNASGNCVVQGNSVITNSNLTKPGDEYYFTINITNNGTIPAKIKNVTSPNNVDGWWQDAGDCAYLDKSTYMVAYYMGPNDCDSDYQSNTIILQPGKQKEITIEHLWLDSDAWALGEQPKLPNGQSSINYNIVFEFEQVTN